jgi:hypothetical protein
MVRMPDLKPAAPTSWYRYPDAPAVVGPTSMPVTFTPGARLGSAALA